MVFQQSVLNILTFEKIQFTAQTVRMSNLNLLASIFISIH